MVNILKDEKIGLDVVSEGELYIAFKCGFDMKSVIFHGNNKSDNEIRMGIDFGAHLLYQKFLCLQYINHFLLYLKNHVTSLITPTS